jgi:endothelin-converting enzyme/putative endopeptidase
MRSTSSIPLVALVALASCSPRGEPRAPTTESSSPPEPLRTPAAPARPSIELGDIDRSADPCGDFYQYANGAWRAHNPIPAGKPRWSRRELARDANTPKLRTVLQETAAKADWPAGSAEQLAGDHYAACMDVATIDAAGLAPIAPLLAELDAVKTRADVQRAIRRLHDVGIAAAFGELATYDYHEPKDTVVSFGAGALGLGDRDAYGKPELRAKYRLHVARVLALAGLPDRAADGVIALEQRLAQASLDATTAGDPAKTAHRTTYAQLVAMAPHVEWAAYFDEARLPRTHINVAEPGLIPQVDKELQATPVAVWKAYLQWQVLDAASPWLATAFAAEALAFKPGPPRDQRCADLTEAILPEPAGKKFADKYFPPEAKARAKAIADNLRAVLREQVEQLTWLSPDARQEAVAKITGMTVEIGYPDHWKDLSKLRIRRDALWANIVEARRFNVADGRRQVGAPTDRRGWVISPASLGGYLDFQLDELVLAAGFIQPRYFDPALSDAASYGVFGAGLAHDMSHMIDATGSIVDAQGHTRTWWGAEDQQAFHARAQCVVDQFEGFAIEPGVHHDGKRVLDEALADQTGLHLAFLALKRALAKHPGEIVDGFTPEQQFFLAWGQFRGEDLTLEAQRELVKTDNHPVPRFRVLGPLANLPEFARAFGCKAGAPMVRANRCAVWENR